MRRKPMDNSSDSGYHIPVMLKEVTEGLNIIPGGIYVDCTFGGGGHSRAILERLSSSGRLIAFDQDPDARRNIPDDPRVLFVPQNFRYLQRFLRLHEIENPNGILADLGVSSHQFDEADRGFSTRFDAKMDMRMDTRSEKTAFDILQNYSREDLQKIFSEYGEVTNSKTLAAEIVSVRDSLDLSTINQFKAAISGIVRGNPNKYFAQVFQALRIELNEELEALKEMLVQAAEVLKPGGRIAVITFHSLEDRIVKNFFKLGSFEQEEEVPFIQTEKKRPLKQITRKPLIPQPDEIKLNPRSRSAKLRIAEKI